MTDLTEWLKERRTIHDAATEDAARVLWEHDDPEGESPNENFEDEPKWERERLKQAAQAVLESSDAHNTLPTLLTAVEKVLERHHWERDEYGCWTCRFCSHIQQAKILYPCATVRTVEGAIK